MYARATTRRRVQDIARVIAFSASDDSDFMTGTYAPVNGGLAMD
jgi:3-oxoacyl-[acyl-carrier protein] reductase